MILSNQIVGSCLCLVKAALCVSPLPLAAVWVTILYEKVRSKDRCERRTRRGTAGSKTARKRTREGLQVRGNRVHEARRAVETDDQRPGVLEEGEEIAGVAGRGIDG